MLVWSVSSWWGDCRRYMYHQTREGLSEEVARPWSVLLRLRLPPHALRPSVEVTPSPVNENNICVWTSSPFIPIVVRLPSGSPCLITLSLASCRRSSRSSGPKTRRLLWEDITCSDATEREVNILPQHSSYDPQNELLGHLKWPTVMDEGCCYSVPWSSIIHWVIALKGKQDDPISSCMSRSRSQRP
jgi:hypothetical protein